MRFFQWAREQIKPYQNQRREPKGEVFPGVTAVPLYGHTPGHTGYLVSSKGEQLADLGRHRPHPGHPDAPAGRLHGAGRRRRRPRSRRASASWIRSRPTGCSRPACTCTFRASSISIAAPAAATSWSPKSGIRRSERAPVLRSRLSAWLSGLSTAGARDRRGRRRLHDRAVGQRRCRQRAKPLAETTTMNTTEATSATAAIFTWVLPLGIDQRVVVSWRVPFDRLNGSSAVDVSGGCCECFVCIAAADARSSVIDWEWYSWVGSNHRPPVPQTGALTN